MPHPLPAPPLCEYLKAATKRHLKEPRSPRPPGYCSVVQTGPFGAIGGPSLRLGGCGVSKGAS